MNLGKRRIKMDQLRTLFEEMGFSEVETFIASGNVLFTAGKENSLAIETLIERSLEQSLDYSVDTFVRTRRELAAIAAFQPFSAAEMAAKTNTFHVGFLKETLSPSMQRSLLACRTEVDEFRVAGREFYWLCRIRTNESKVWTSPQMKGVKLPTTTMRNLTTVRKLGLNFPAPG